MESPIAPPRTLCGQGPSTLAQLQLIRPHVEVVAHRAAMGAKQTTGTPLRERVGRFAGSPRSGAGPVSRWALPVFCGDILERLIVECEIGDDLFELAVFFFYES